LYFDAKLGSHTLLFMLKVWCFVVKFATPPPLPVQIPISAWCSHSCLGPWAITSHHCNQFVQKSTIKCTDKRITFTISGDKISDAHYTIMLLNLTCANMTFEAGQKMAICMTFNHKNNKIWAHNVKIFLTIQRSSFWCPVRLIYLAFYFLFDALNISWIVWWFEILDSN
jgi:hypothetical protein